MKKSFRPVYFIKRKNHDKTLPACKKKIMSEIFQIMSDIISRTLLHTKQNTYWFKTSNKQPIF